MGMTPASSDVIPWDQAIEAANFPRPITRVISTGRRNTAVTPLCRISNSSVLLHRLWVTGEEYQAIGYGQSTQEAA
jgi:hypothetical protein